MVFIFCGSACAQETQKISSLQLTDAVKEAVIKTSEWPADDVNIEFKNPPADEMVPAGNVTISARCPKKKPLGLTPVEVSISVNAQEVKRVMTYAQVDVKTEVIVSTRWIKRSEPLTGENSAVVQAYRSKIPFDALSQREEVEGKVVKVAIPKGKFITQSLLETPPLIKKQDFIDIVFDQKGIKVVTKGIALANGQRDEVIKVRNNDSKRELYGKVKDAHTVEVQ